MKRRRQVPPQRLDYAKARGIDFNMSFIDKDYPGEGHKLFDTADVRGLCDHGVELGRTGKLRQKRPPGQDE